MLEKASPPNPTDVNISETSAEKREGVVLSSRRAETCCSRKVAAPPGTVSVHRPFKTSYSHKLPGNYSLKKEKKKKACRKLFAFTTPCLKSSEIISHWLP